jgi:hypothetical protein
VSLDGHEPLATIVSAAETESAVWSESLLPLAARRREAPWAPLCGERFAAGLEAIYEGHLLHHGRPRLFAPRTDGARLLLGDFLYARGLAWIAERDDVEAIAALADLIALSAQARAERDGSADDFALWAATASFLASRANRAAFAAARDAMRVDGDTAPLEALVADIELDGARAAHRELSAALA